MFHLSYVIDFEFFLVQTSTHKTFFHLFSAFLTSSNFKTPHSQLSRELRSWHIRYNASTTFTSSSWVRILVSPVPRSLFVPSISFFVVRTTFFTRMLSLQVSLSIFRQHFHSRNYYLIHVVFRFCAYLLRLAWHWHIAGVIDVISTPWSGELSLVDDFLLVR